MSLQPVSLYFHVPFCLKRCPYCDFYSTTSLEKRQEFADALCRAIANAPLEGYEVKTIYFGGGTPSLMGLLLIEVLEAVKRQVPVAEDVEITLEANPGAVQKAELFALHKAGFNRISFGLQAGEDEGLHTLGRIHTAEEGAAAVALARQAGFDNISVDIMLATPGQDKQKAVALAEYTADLGVEHISAYLLKIEAGTPFARSGIEKNCPGADEAAELYLAVCRQLKKRGYQHYEISNFARSGYQSRHNNVYWKLGEYLGIGPSAHSFFGGRRFYFPADLQEFMNTRQPWQLVQDDGTGGDWEELVMLRLRLQEGLPLEEARRLDATRTAMLERRAKPLEAGGLLTINQDVMRLSEEGFLLSNSVLTALLA